MKKLFAMFVIAGMVGFVACGPSAEEKAEKQRIQDSITADSTAQVVAAQQAEMDTADAVKARAEDDSIAKLPVKK